MQTKLLALAALGVLVLAGCAQPGGTGVATAPTSNPPAPATTLPLPPQPSLSPSGGSTPDAVDQAGCHTNLRLTETDTGKTYCLHAGGTVSVELHGAPGQPWRPVALTGDALELTAGAPPNVAATVTDTYRAVHTGHSQLASSRPMCPPSRVGGAACMAMQGFQVTIDVS
jgi:hypothetical protein